MTLVESINKIKTDFGDDFIASNRFLGALKDNLAFADEEPYVASIFARLVADGYVREVLKWKNVSKRKYISKADDLAYKFSQKYATRQDAVYDVIGKLCLGLGIIDEVPQQKNEEKKTSILNVFSFLQKQPAPKSVPHTPNATPINAPVSQQTNSPNPQPIIVPPKQQSQAVNVRSQNNVKQPIDILSILHKEDTAKWPEIIWKYPIPSDRNDFIQLVKFLQDHSNNGDRFGNTCKNKLDECRKRAIVIYAKDTQLSQMLCYGEHKRLLEKKEKVRQVSLKVIKVLLKIIAFFAIISLIVFGVKKCTEHNSEEVITEQELQEMTSGEVEDINKAGGKKKIKGNNKKNIETENKTDPPKEIANEPKVPIFKKHQYVDLGLPSGTFWSTMNIGAKSMSDKNPSLFAWGEVKPKSRFSKSNYIYEIYYLGKEISGTDYDVALKNWGKGWQMPSLEQCKELIDNTSQEKKYIDGNLCLVVKSKINNAEIVIPEVVVDKTDDNPNGYCGFAFWIGTHCSTNCAYRMWEWSNISISKVHQGYPVRPVVLKTTVEQNNE